MRGSHGGFSAVADIGRAGEYRAFSCAVGFDRAGTRNIVLPYADVFSACCKLVAPGCLAGGRAGDLLRLRSEAPPDWDSGASEECNCFREPGLIHFMSCAPPLAACWSTARESS